MDPRSKGIGGTDISAIVGLNPWRSPMDVYMEKTGLVEPQPDNEALYWGRELEPAVLKRYAKETGYQFVPGKSVQGKEDWILGTPDAICPPDGGVDAKTTGFPDAWGPAPDPAGVPDHISCQAAWYMGITGAAWWDIALLILSPRREFRIYRIERDQEVIDSLVEAGRDFWFNHILAQIPPSIDGSPGASEYLKRMYPKDMGDIIAAPNGAERLIEDYFEAKGQLATFEYQLKEAENSLKAMIGDATGILGQGWKATWKATKGRTVTDWQAAYMDLCAYAHEKGIVINDEDFSGKHTQIKPGHRTFRVWELKEGK